MTALSTLTAQQCEQVRYLFCDEIFGTDPTHYEYEVHDDSVVGRKLIATNNQPPRKPRHVSMNVSVMDDPNATGE